MTSVFSGLEGLVGSIRKGLPETGDTVLALAAASSAGISPLKSVSSIDLLQHDPIEPDLSAEGVSKALRSLSRGFRLPGKEPLAMDFRAHYGVPMSFSDYHGHIADTRRCLDCVLLTSRDGEDVLGLLPLPEKTEDLRPVCDSLPGFDGTLVTDTEYYSKTNICALDRWGGDWLLIQPPFPVSLSNRNMKMSQLRHRGRDYETCKARYDKRWLFRFTDLSEREEVLARIPLFCTDRRDEDLMRFGAGMTDVLSDQSFDIREVRRMMDVRSRWDGVMCGFWDRLIADSPADRDEAFALMCLYVLGLTVRSA